MVRKDGYLDLDLYFKDLKEKENLTNDDLVSKGLIQKIDDSDYYYWLKIDNKDYMFKATSFKPINELICYELASIMGIEAIPYDLAIYDDKFGVISENYEKNNCKYVSGTMILKNYYRNEEKTLIEMGFDKEESDNEKIPYHVQMNNLEVIWQALEYKYPNYDISKCMEKLVLQFIFVILSGQVDKSAHNWEIEEYEDHIDLVPLFDNTLSFYNILEEGEMSVSFEDVGKTLKDNLIYFLQVSSKEYINLFLEKYSLLTEENMIEIFKKIEQKIECEISNSTKQKLLYDLKLNKNIIDEVLNELNIDNNLRSK